MDRVIPKEERQKERRKMMMKYGAAALAVVVVLLGLVAMMRTGVKEKDLVFSAVSEGTIEVSVSA